MPGRDFSAELFGSTQQQGARDLSEELFGASKPTGPAPSRLERIGRGMMDPINGGAQLLTNVLPDSVVQAGNRVNNWLADKTGLVARLPEGGVDQQVRQDEAAYQARRAAAGELGFDGYRFAGNIASPANLALATKAPAAVSLAGRIASGVAAGGASSALAPVTDGEFWGEKAKQVATGAAIGGVIPAVGAGLSRVVSPVASRNTNVKLLRDEGVNPTIGQVLGGRWNAVEEKMQSLPIVGDAIANARGKALKEFNQAAINRTTSPIGVRVDEIGREGVAQAKQALSGAYNTLLPKLRFQADSQFSNELTAIQSMVDSSLPRATGRHSLPGEADIFDTIIKRQVISKMTPAGTMSGETFKQVEGELSRMARGYKGDQSFDKRQLGAALQSVVDSMRTSLSRSNPSEAAQLSRINQGFANYARIRDAAGRSGSENGVMTPAQLQAAVRAADKSVGKGSFATGNAVMQDLSEAGRAVIGNKVPNSFTTDRALIAGGTLGSYLLNPAIPLSLLGGASLYTSPAQRALVAAATARPALAQPVAEGLQQAAPMLVPAGAQLGLSISNY